MAASILGILSLAALLVVLSAVLVAGAALSRYRRKAVAAGYPTLGAYLRAAPRDDEEKRDAVDLLLKGVVLCLLGLLFPPLLLVGVFPLFFGLRKVVYAQMGFGLLEDAEPPSA